MLDLERAPAGSSRGRQGVLWDPRDPLSCQPWCVRQAQEDVDHVAELREGVRDVEFVLPEQVAELPQLAGQHLQWQQGDFLCLRAYLFLFKWRVSQGSTCDGSFGEKVLIICALSYSSPYKPPYK